MRSWLVMSITRKACKQVSIFWTMHFEFLTRQRSILLSQQSVRAFWYAMSVSFAGAPSLRWRYGDQGSVVECRDRCTGGGVFVWLHGADAGILYRHWVIIRRLEPILVDTVTHRVHNFSALARVNSSVAMCSFSHTWCARHRANMAAMQRSPDAMRHV